MAYNSDYDVRLATLGALGGDTAKTYDSVYDIDLAILDAIEHGGGGGGMDYNQMKQLLAASGVTEILFIGNGSGETVTLDYDLISQIGQGGGDYICVSTIDELSGITDPKDGMLVYVGAHDVQEEAVVFSVDYYNDGGWCRFIADYSGTTQQIGFTEQGKNMNIERGHFLREYTNDEWFWAIQDNRNELPTNFIGENSNGVEGTLVSNINGAEYDEHNECANTVYFYSLNGVLPTITLHPEDVGNVTFVSSSITTETVTRHYKAIGMFKYYADINKWLAYNIDFDVINSALLQDIADDYLLYKKTLGGYRKTKVWTDEWNKNTPVHYYAYGIYEDNNISFHSDIAINALSGELLTTSFRIYKESDVWILDNVGDRNINNMVSQGTAQTLNGRLYTQHSDYDGGLDYGGLYSVPVEGTFSGTTYSTTITYDPTADGYSQHLGELSIDNRGRWIGISEVGIISVDRQLTYSATTNADWHVMDYVNAYDYEANNHALVFGAIKLEDNGDDTFTANIFVRDWVEGTGFSPDDERGYTWTVTTGQTLTVSPAVYMAVRGEYGTQHRTTQTAKKIYNKATVVMTEAEYQSLAVKDPNTIYYLTSN